MYDKTITLFCHYVSASADIYYPHVIKNVDFHSDKAAVIARFGENSQDNAIIHIRYTRNGDDILVGGKKYLPPKEWRNQTNDQLIDAITIHGGQDFDFIYIGEWDSDPVNDEDYTDGFYNYMNKRFDDVFAVSSVAKYDMIPHFEISAK